MREASPTQPFLTMHLLLAPSPGATSGEITDPGVDLDLPSPLGTQQSPATPQERSEPLGLLLRPWVCGGVKGGVTLGVPGQMFTLRLSFPCLPASCRFFTDQKELPTQILHSSHKHPAVPTTAPATPCPQWTRCPQADFRSAYFNLTAELLTGGFSY